jgi:ribosomal protein L16 Arg81 hydroxylase
MTLAEVLAPLNLAEFLRDYVGQRPAILKGTPGRFHHLVTWQDLNQALTVLRADNERVLLIKNARPLLPSSYLLAFGSKGGAQVNGPALVKHLAAGATLVVAKVDEVLLPVRRLAESCEREFHIHTGVNLYAGWRTDNGFDVHWDKHDTLILQVKGEKDWKIWAPTREHPLAEEPIDAAPAPTSTSTAEPYWQGVLQDGDVLYMPRGWWHVAHPRNTLSLHITVGLKHPTGIDFLGWILERVKASVQARNDVPHWAPAADRSAWLQSMRELCAEALADGALERYMESTTANAQTRPIVHLQDKLAPIPVLLDSTRLRLSRGERLPLRSSGEGDDATIAFDAGGVEWQCSAALRPALDLLGHIEPCTLQDMTARLGAHARPLLRPFITGLLLSEVIWAEPNEAENIAPRKQPRDASVGVA